MNMRDSADNLVFENDYPNFPEFARYGIDLSLTDSRTILVLQRARNIGRFSIFPGGYQDNWGRTGGSKTSEHYAVGRLSTAGDIFPARGKVLRLWIILQNIEWVGGLGLYLDVNGPDGQPWIMLHYDLRESKNERTFWIRDAYKYTLLHLNPDKFWHLFKHVIERD